MTTFITITIGLAAIAYLMISLIDARRTLSDQRQRIAALEHRVEQEKLCQAALKNALVEATAANHRLRHRPPVHLPTLPMFFTLNRN